MAIVSGNLQRMARLSALREAVSSRLTMAREEMARIQKLLGHLSLLTRRCRQRWYEASRELSLQLKGIERGDELVVQTDPRALMLALDQLLDNACQHANRSMPIQLSLAGMTGATIAWRDLEHRFSGAAERRSGLSANWSGGVEERPPGI